MKRAVKLSGYVWWLQVLDNEMKRQLTLTDRKRSDGND